MRAILYRRYGGPEALALEEIEIPTIADHQVLIKVRAAALNPLDWRMMRGQPILVRTANGLFKPKNPQVGVDVAGVVEAVGKNVTRLKPGDEVFGVGRGTVAEYAAANERGLALKPASLGFEQAAAIPVAAITALQSLREQGQLRAGQRVLINGAAGGVGTFTVQIAKAMGGHVTGVCSGRNLEMIRSLGADAVIDYEKEDCTSGTRFFDLIIDNVGNLPLGACLRMLTPTGSYVIVGAPKGGSVKVLKPMAKAWIWSKFSRRRLCVFMATITPENLGTMIELMESGKVRAIFERVYSLNEASEAMRYLETGHAKGKLIIRL